MGILNIGVRALQANSVALQTAGNNIANVNTAGYSRQNVVLEAVQGQFSGGGYIGKGVGVQTIQRNFSEFLTRQATLASATQSGDTIRANKLSQLEGIFPGGANGLGAAVNDMLNAFSDVASAPTDLTARTVVLTRMDETAARMRSASQSLTDLQAGVSLELQQKMGTVNTLTQGIADINGQIAKIIGAGQAPNDLLDRRDQLVRDLNQYVQTTSIAADDGTVGIFIGGSQALVLGTQASTISLVADDYGVAGQKLAINRSGVSISMDESMLGGGEIPGLLRFQNTDLNEGRNLLGRFTLAITDSMNAQHALGLDLDGNTGGNVFSPADFSQTVFAATSNAVPATATLAVSVSDASSFQASNYKVTFASPATTPASGTWTRMSDKVPTPVAFTLPALPAAQSITIDGLAIAITGTPGAGNEFLLKPFSTAANSIQSALGTPRALAVASPIVAKLSTANTGSLQVVGVKANGQPAGFTVPASPIAPATSGAGVKLSFAAGPPVGFVVTGTTTPPVGFSGAYTPGVTVVPYTPGAAISIDGWEVTLTGTPKANDSLTIGNAKDAQYGSYYTRNAGNATALMDLRDAPLFDGAALTDGYASLMAQIGVRAQSANYAAEVSSSIAASLDKDRTGVSGVNLDEEAAKLLQFQQAYQASAKMIQIAQSMFDTLMQGLGR